MRGKPPVISPDGAAMLYCLVGLVRFLGDEEIISPEAFAAYLKGGAGSVPELAHPLLNTIIESIPNGARMLTHRGATH